LPFHWSDILPYYQKEYQVYRDELSKNSDTLALRPVHNGLSCILFGSPGMVDPRRIFTTPTLEFDWANQPPDDGRNWSVQLNGYIAPPQDADIAFHIHSDQSTRIYIDNNRLAMSGDNGTMVSANVALKRKTWHALRIEYDNVDSKESNLIIKWSIDVSPAQPIENKYLRHSDYHLNMADRMVLLGF
jgi:hypothetical protein